MKLYGFVSILGFLLRNFVLPNPFQSLYNEIIINVFQNEMCLKPDVLNYIVEPIYATFTFLIVGLYYVKGSNAVLGSVLYSVFYCIHCGFIYVIAYFHFVPIAIIITIILYVLMHILILK